MPGSLPVSHYEFQIRPVSMRVGTQAVFGVHIQKAGEVSLSRLGTLPGKHEATRQARAR